MVLQLFQHLFKVAKMLLLGFATDQEIVYIAYIMGNSLQDCVHSTLKNSWSRCHSEQQAIELVEPFVSVNCVECLGLLI